MDSLWNRPSRKTRFFLPHPFNRIEKDQMVGGCPMDDYIKERVLEVALYIVENRATVRQAASVFKVSKSTVHKDVTERLPGLNKHLAREVRKILDINKAERYLRGEKPPGVNTEPSKFPEGAGIFSSPGE